MLPQGFIIGLFNASRSINNEWSRFDVQRSPIHWKGEPNKADFKEKTSKSFLKIYDFKSAKQCFSSQLCLWCFIITWKNRTADFTEKKTSTEQKKFLVRWHCLANSFSRWIDDDAEFLVNDFWSVIVQYHEWKREKIDSHLGILGILLASESLRNFLSFERILGI
jgi:hypothetical protein